MAKVQKNPCKNYQKKSEIPKNKNSKKEATKPKNKVKKDKGLNSPQPVVKPQAKERQKATKSDTFNRTSLELKSGQC
ncbi:hypothetical protein [Haloflavibacter putidus]|uniref:Uncharacterized protein n=1 Tax=Haloflavibacter putidus TaxID=2576776 RepID=A0A507ZIJ7_9FLAO|nr:hypothetical protein [Haloflavibacter putidus]TQD37009.1 hypothetical protein FKR84_10415 [Haloflavibacter putidus]